MPSAEETTYLIEVMPESGLSQDSFTSRDVDVLVSRIKENLRLSSLKSRSSHHQHKMRASPYTLPSRCELCSDSEHQQQQQQQQGSTTTGSASCSTQYNCRKKHRKQHRISATTAFDLDDSYERFQALLRNGALIKEAVKRLQTSPEENDDEDDRVTSTSATSTTIDSMDEEEDELYRRKRFYYDSEDEPPVYHHQPLDL